MSGHLAKPLSSRLHARPVPQRADRRHRRARPDFAEAGQRERSQGHDDVPDGHVEVVPAGEGLLTDSLFPFRDTRCNRVVGKVLEEIANLAR